MELVSGPDLGAGFLFQLTVAAGDGPSHWIVHAQEGGIDASGPPKGSPEPFGFHAYPGVCPIGGRPCYHRELDADPRDAARVRMGYNRTRFVMAGMLEQQYGGQVVPLAATVQEVVGRIAAPLRESGRPWFLGGAAAVWLYGLADPPRSVEIGTDAAGVVAIADALGEYLTEPPGTADWEGRRRVFGGRAYVGTLRAGAQVAWCSAETSVPRFPVTSEWGAPAADVPTIELTVAGIPIRVPRPELLLFDAARAKDRVRLAAIARHVQKTGAKDDLIDVLRAAAPPPERAAVDAALAAASAGSLGS
jgi:hypothetical protein